jgi:two-component system cell cycle sensor histidine kinase/response regulator CckA
MIMDASTLHSAGETLLIVDDEPLITDLFKQFMTRRGYTVLTASDGQEALRRVDEAGTAIKLVITDMTMLGMDGIAVARALEQRLPGVPVLIATGHDATLDRSTMPGNVVDIVQKPYQNRQLAERIRKLLDNGDSSAPA